MRRYRLGAVATVIAFLLMACEEVVYDTGGYISPEQFLSRYGWAFDLPRSAAQVRAKLYSAGTQQNTLFLRFQCSSADLLEVAHQWARSSAFPQGRTLHPLPLSDSDFTETRSLDWWQPRKISTGYYLQIDSFGGHGIRAWFDETNSIAYICSQG